MTLLTTAEVAEQLKLSHSQIKKMIQRGELPHIRILRSVRIDQAELDKWVKGNRVPVRTGSFLHIGASNHTGDAS